MRLKDFRERQNRVLKVIISSYVNTALPVGSRMVSRIVGLSSATIRNIMSDLEELGYLTHPHTSAGRIPTDKGYRCYVESLTRLKEINKKEARLIAEEYRARRRNIEDIIRKTAEILANITHQTGVVLFPKFKKSVFKHIDLILLGPKRLLVVFITSAGIVRNLIIGTQEDLGSDLNAISNLLNGDYYGTTLSEIKSALFERLKRERDSFYHVIRETSEVIDSILELFREDELYLGGASCLLSQPEFGDADSVKSILQIFENKDALSKMLEEDLEKEGVAIYIGRENRYRNMRHCALLTSGYRIGEELVGRLGIIGPTRMEYGHLIPLVNYISETVTRTLSEITA